VAHETFPRCSRRTKILFDFKCTDQQIIKNRIRHHNGFCASGPEGINISICAAIISGSRSPEFYQQMKNNQLFYSIFGNGSGRRDVEFSIFKTPGGIAILLNFKGFR
jgi:hypothetical protein